MNYGCMSAYSFIIVGIIGFTYFWTFTITQNPVIGAVVAICIIPTINRFLKLITPESWLAALTVLLSSSLIYGCSHS